MRLHPIHYSLIINLVVMAIAGGLAWAFSQPLVFILAVILSNHALERFRNDPPGAGRDSDDDEDPEYSESRAGFTADISKS